MYSLSAEGGCSHTVNWKEEKVCVGRVGGGGFQMYVIIESRLTEAETLSCR